MKYIFKLKETRHQHYQAVISLCFLLCMFASCQTSDKLPNDTAIDSPHLKVHTDSHATKSSLPKPDDLKLRIGYGIKNINQGDDVSKMDLSTIEKVNIAIAIFKVYARLIRDGKASSDKEVQNMTKTLQKKTMASQLKNFPRIRKAYYEIVKDKLWEHDINVTIGGSNNTILKLTGGYFAANANIKATQESLQEILTSLRFRQSQYRWYNGQDEYTYYTIESHKDGMLIE